MGSDQQALTMTRPTDRIRGELSLTLRSYLLAI